MERNEKKVTLNVLIDELKEDQVASKKTENKKKIVEEGEVKELGIKLVNLSDEIRIRRNIPEDIYGLLVLKVEQNSEAERKGIRPGHNTRDKSSSC